MPRWPRSGRWSCRCGWGSRPAKPSCGVADYFGAVLNRVARVMAAGHGGQILLAESTAGLLSGVDLVDLGPRRLRDLPTPVRGVPGPSARATHGLSAVAGAGCESGEPAACAHQLHRARVRGRRAASSGEGASAGDVDRCGRGRQDPPGAGSRRRGWPMSFPDGVWFFELAAVADPAAVPDAVAAVLGITQQPGKSVSRERGRRAGGQSPVAGVRQLRARARRRRRSGRGHPRALGDRKVLATSREGLGVADEQLWPVPSLEVGAGIDSAAVTLFVDRARSVAPRFSLAEPDEADAVVEICRRLDGIPLAIELAASRMASMTAIEVRDRLDQRFRLLVGSRRGLERHHTLRHAVAWSYDLLDDGEKSLLERCSVFAGGFDLQSACAVAGSDDSDDFAVLDLLDALVRKSLLVADRSAGRTRFSMLETIRQFAEEQLVASGEATRPGPRTPVTSPGAKPTSWPCGTAPDSARPTTWFTIELANLRTAFRWAADHGDLDVAATIATYAAFLGLWSKIMSRSPGPKSSIEPARAVDHPRLGALYVMASQCYMTGRIEAAVRYSDAGQLVIGSGRGGAVRRRGLAWRCVPEPSASPNGGSSCAAPSSHAVATPTANHQGCLVCALVLAGCGEEAMGRRGRPHRCRRSHRNPHVLAFALSRLRVRLPRRQIPSEALDALAPGPGDRSRQRQPRQRVAAGGRSVPLEADTGDPLAALDYLTLAIRNYHDCGNTTMIRIPLASPRRLFRPARTL